MKPVESLLLAEQEFRLGWTDLLAPGSPADTCAAWLDQLRDSGAAARRALVLLRSAGNELHVAAARPAGTRLDDLAEVLSRASTTLGPTSHDVAGGVLLAVPLLRSGQLHGLVAIELDGRSGIEAALKTINFGSGWLIAMLVLAEHEQQHGALGQARSILEAIAAVLAQPDFQASALATANHLAAVWQADAVLIGWVDARRTAVVARSNAADSDERANLVNHAVAAMEEAFDLGHTVQWQAGPPAASAAANLPEHRVLARESRAEAIATALLFDQGVAVGAVLIGRGHPLTAMELDTLDTQCMMLAPLLAQKRSAGRSLLEHGKAQARAAAHALGDGSHLGWKLATAAFALFLVLAALIPIPLRIAAPAVVEGEVQRSIAAPFQGFIRAAHARAGDTVRSGQVLATLEDKDLQLDRARWSADLELAGRKEREAMAAGNRVDVRLAAAQANQARAQLDLVQQKLDRVQITAPFDGVVVRGDLSQLLGSPVEQGKVLFELAPLDAWRVILKVDERDIGHLRAAQQGELMLAGLSGLRHHFAVTHITSVAVVEEGRNHFRVEAALSRHDVKLRPGMEGVAKVDAGSAAALWVWTRRLGDWLRLTLWEWSP